MVSAIRCQWWLVAPSVILLQSDLMDSVKALSLPSAMPSIITTSRQREKSIQYFMTANPSDSNPNTSPEQQDTTSTSSFTPPSFSDSSSNNSSSESGCPFSATFQRYRIDLTRGKDTNDKRRNTSFSLLQKFKSTIDRSALERKYNPNNSNNDDHIQYKVRWVEEEIRTKLREEIKEGEVGVHVSAMVWRAVADLVSPQNMGDHPVYEYENGSDVSVSVSVLAFPLASRSCLRQLAEIVNWWGARTGTRTTNRHENETANKDSAEVLFDAPPSGYVVTASFDEDVSVPTILLTSHKRHPCHFDHDDDDLDDNPNSIQSSSQSQSLPVSKLVEARTKAWVDRTLVKMGICPFTKSVTKSGQGLSDVGVPVAAIDYCYSSASPDSIPALFADTWEAISKMIQSGPSGKNGISSILLGAPSFDAHFPLWSGPIFAMLEATVSAAQAEPIVGIVCFHPQYATPDGTSWPGFGHMHSVPRLRKWLEEEYDDDDEKEVFFSPQQLTEEDVAAGGAYQRRTPHATINVLRADQLEAAEGRRVTGKLYAENVRLIWENGLEVMEQELQRERNMI